MRCRTISLDSASAGVTGRGPLNATQTENAVNKALMEVEIGGNRIVATHLLGSRLGPGEVTTIQNAMLMILFEPNDEVEGETVMPYAG